MAIYFNQPTTGIFSGKSQEIENQINRIIAKTLDDITGVVKQHIFFKTPVATGALRNSLQTQRISNKGKVYFVNPGSAYAAYVENGRAPGKQPPSDPIERWLKSSRQGQIFLSKVAASMKGKKISQERLLKTAAYLVARKIGRKGTKAQKFFQTGIDESQSTIAEIQERLTNELAKVLV